MEYRKKRTKKYKLIALVSMLAIVAQAIYPFFDFLPSFNLLKQSPTVSANDDILSTGETEKVMFQNVNPEFKVEFGNKEQQDQPFVRFEALSDKENPFAKEKNEEIKEGIFERLSSAVLGEKEKGIEFGLREGGTDLSHKSSVISPKSEEPRGEWEKEGNSSQFPVLSSQSNTNPETDPSTHPSDSVGMTSNAQDDKEVLETQAEMQAEQKILDMLEEQLDEMIKEVPSSQFLVPSGAQNDSENLELGTRNLDQYREQLKDQILADLTRKQAASAPTEITQIDNPEDKNTKQDIVKNPDVFPSVDLEYRIMEEKGVKEEIVIKSNEGFSKGCSLKEMENGEWKMENNAGDECSLPKNEFIFDLKLDPGVVMKHAIGATNQTPAGTTYFEDEKGKYLFHFLPLYAYDATGVKTNAVKLEIVPSSQFPVPSGEVKTENQELPARPVARGTKNLELGTGNYTMKVIVDLNWLLSPSRVFPIKIDPSIVHDTEVEFDAGNALNRVESLSDPKVDINNPQGGNDPYTKLLLHADGTDGSTTFTDHSMPLAQRKTVTANGNAHVEVDQSKFGGASGYFDGTGDYLSIPNSSNFNFGSGDFTVDFWVRFTSTSGAQVFAGRNGSSDRSWSFYYNSGNLRFAGYWNGGVQDEAFAWSPSTNTWYHVAVARNGADLKAFIDGTQIGSTYNFSTYSIRDSSSVFYVGENVQETGYGVNGYIDEFRISKGIARWTNTFTAPTKPYDFQKPYGDYISDELDLTSGIQSIDSLQWTENGVRTGDGETEYSATSLVSEWNFNETSGTTADNSAGAASCGGTDSNCDLTLTGFQSTASQDAIPQQGWTSDNKRWGAGGLMNDTKTNLLIHGDGAGAPSSFHDSAKGKTITANGGAKMTNHPISANGDAQIATAQSKFSGSSAYLDGTGDYLSASDSADWDWSGDFTIDCWFRLGAWPTNEKMMAIWGRAQDVNNHLIFGLYNNNSATNLMPHLYGYVGGVLINSSVDVAFSVNTWYHIALVRSGSDIFFFVDGTKYVGSSTSSLNLNITADAKIGQLTAGVYGAQQDFNGYIDEFRISKDIARWTSNFTPQTYEYAKDSYTKLLVHANGTNAATAFSDSSGVRAKFGESAAYFDGTGDYLSVPDSDDWYFGTGDFTIDFWVRFSSFKATYNALVSQTDAVSNWQQFLYNNSDHTLVISSNNVNGTVSWTPSTDTWYHLAVVRNGTAFRWYVNGTQVGSDITDADAMVNITGLLTVGYDTSTANRELDGYIDEFRISKGIARWTGNFTAPAAPYYTAVNNPASNALDPVSSDLTIETWIKTSEASNEILSNNNANGTNCTQDGFYLGVNSNGYPVFNLDTNGHPNTCDVSITGTNKINDGSYHHLAVSVARGGSAIMYLDGVSVGTDASVTSYTNVVPPGYFYLSNYSNVLDSTRIYSRALAANEILSEAQAGNIEFETRTGADATPDDGSWEAWKPTTSESQILSLDSDSRNWDGEYDNYTKLLLHSDGADASTTFTDSSLYGKTVTANGNAHVETDMKVFGSASAQFDGTGDYLSASDSADWNMGSGDFTIDCWFYALNNNQTVFAFYGTGWSGGNMQWTLGVHSNKLFAFFDTAGTDIVLYDSVNLPTSTWTHAAFVRSGNNFNLYKNGTSVASGSTASAGNTGTYYFTSGVDYGGASYYTGYLDEVRVSKGIARWTSNFTVPNAAYENPRHGAMGLSDVSNPKAEGSGALKVSTPGSLSQADANVVGLWHMEETGGTGAYIKDATANAHNATPTGTTVVDGIYGKARYFDGNEDYLSISDSSDWNFDTSTSWNVSFWVYPTSSFSSTIFYGRSADDILNGGENYLYYQTASSPNGLSWGPINGEWDSGKTLSLNQWQYVAMIYDTDSETAYACVNGSCSSVAVSSVGSSSGNFKIGDNYNSNFFNGYIDEFKVSKGHAYSVDEVNEQYRLGRDHRVARTISSTDFSSKTKLPFYVAGDRVGTYLEATVGESAYANYLADTNQKLFLHGDENAESTAIKDSSDSAKTVTVNGDVKVKNFGKIGNSIYFDGSGDYLSLADSEDWDFGSGDFTISWWQYPTSASTSGTFGRSITTAYPAFLVLNSSVNMTSNGSSWDIANGKTLGGLTLNTWQHFAIVRNGSNFYTYKNGQVRDSWSSASALNNEAAAFVIGRYTNVLNYDYSGYLDEFGLFKGTAKTAAEIRQTYEIGKRTHPITIDFQAKLDSGNLIADTSDLSFTVDARSYLPTTNYGENLYVGDKVIVKENYDGTEYIAQGTVTAITASTGATTVAAWDAGSTAPAGGYTVNAQVFKWQREWVDVTAPLGSQVDAVTRLTLRCTDGSEGRTVYLDDFKSGGAYLTNPSATGNVTSTVQRYMQYRALFSTTDPAVTPYLSGVTVNYTSGPTNAQLMRHGKWFSSGVKQSFWWARLVPPTPN